MLTNTLNGMGGASYTLGMFNLKTVTAGIKALAVADRNKQRLIDSGILPLLARALRLFADNLPVRVFFRLLPCLLSLKFIDWDYCILFYSNNCPPILSVYTEPFFCHSENRHIVKKNHHWRA